MTGDRDRNVLLLLTGAFAVWLAASGTALNFVKPSMTPYVLAAGVVSVLLALLPPGGLLGRRAEAGGDDDGHAHGETKVAWLLVVPLLVVILVPPAPLGADAIRARPASFRSGPKTFPALRPPTRGAVDMSMAEFTTRALRDPDRSLEGVRVRLTGFVAGPADGGYRLARFVIFCCAADGEAVEVVVHGPGTYDADQWLEVEGVWEPGPSPVLVASGARRIGRPEKPYEYTTVWSG